MEMKRVTENLVREIEFLRALVHLYERDGHETEREATLEAIEALERLLYLINHPTDDSPRLLPVAA